MTFFKMLFGMTRRYRPEFESQKTGEIIRVARAALNKYEKTFADLARYDRGETPIVSILR